MSAFLVSRHLFCLLGSVLSIVWARGIALARAGLPVAAMTTFCMAPVFAQPPAALGDEGEGRSARSTTEKTDPAHETDDEVDEKQSRFEEKITVTAKWT